MLGLSAWICRCAKVSAPGSGSELMPAHSSLFISNHSNSPTVLDIAVLGELSTVYFIEQGATETNLALLISRLFSIFTKFCMMIKLIVITEGQKEDGMSYRHGSLPELQRCFC